MATYKSRLTFLGQVVLLAGVAYLAGAEINLGGLGGGALAAERTVKAAPMNFYSLPGHSTLGRKDVQDEIGLSADQVAKLNEINQKYMESFRQGGRVDFAKLSVDERRKKFEELAVENRKRAEDVRKQVEAVLKPEQLKKLETIELRQHASQTLLYGQAAEKLGLSAEQKDKLHKSREDLTKKITELQQQMQKQHDQAGKAALDVLTPEQLEQLKKLHRDGVAGTRVGPTAQPVPVPKK